MTEAERKTGNRRGPVVTGNEDLERRQEEWKDSTMIFLIHQ